MNDLRFAFRQLLKSPAFTLLALLTLTLGIGMNTAIFSLIHDIFLRSLPFEKPAQLVRIYGEARDRNLDEMPFSLPRYWHYRDAQTVFNGTAADSGNGYILTGLGEPIQLFGANVTANYFQLLGIQPKRGRLFLPEEESKADVALVTESFWRSRLASDPSVLGRSLTLNGVPTTIIGVLPNLPETWFGPDAHIFTVKPFELPGTPRELLMRGVSYLRVIGRLQPGGTIEQAQAALQPVHEAYRSANPEKADNSWVPVVISATEDLTGDLRPAFVTLLAAVAAVLLIACSNVANLLLVRFTGRKREIALRMALGASRGGVVRLFVLESTIVSVAAGIAGVVLAAWIISTVPQLAGDNLPLPDRVSFSWPIFAFTLGLSLLTGILMGAYPAWQSSRADLANGLKDGGRSVSGGVSQQRFRRSLVAAQVTFSVILLAGASLLIASFFRLSREDSGIKPDGIWVGGIGLPESSYADAPARARFAERLRTELGAAGGIEAAAISDVVPLTGNFSRSPYARAEGAPPPINQRPLGNMHSISPGYLRTFGIPLLAGRDFDERDTEDRPNVVLISKATRQKVFPNEDPIGKQMFFGTNDGTGLKVEIVGVVGDVRSEDLSELNEVEFYRPFAQRNFNFLQVSARGRIQAEAIGGVVRGVLNRLDPALPIIQPTTMPEIIGESLGQERLTMALLGSFASVALLLALVGIYGAVAYTVEQRTPEIGVRMALGAQTRDVLGMVVRQGMLPVIIGLAAGLAGTLLLSRLLTAQLYEISPHNPAVLGTTVMALALVALVACLIPARRATLVNPIQALRTE